MKIKILLYSIIIRIIILKMERKIGIVKVNLKQKYLNVYTFNFTTKIQRLISHLVVSICKMVPLQSSLIL